jgi:hypothetical protein
MQSFARLWTNINRGTLVAVLMLATLFSMGGCQKSDQPKEHPAAGSAVFATPDAAATAIFEAAKSGDLNRVYSIFGEETRDYLVPADAAAAAASLQTFADDYQQMHRWTKLTDGGLTLEIGVESYAFPFPLRKNSAGQWAFDAGAGRKEIQARRIGDNELYTLQVLETMTTAQTEYFSQPRDGGKIRQYAQKFWSDPGKHNGLYWKPAENELESPLGPLAAQAAAEGYPGQAAPATPFHGYFYRILTKQGTHAKGGVKDYITNGSMTRGFSFLAYPAEYRKSGVMTFLINQDGVIYQCDLGDHTNELAQQLDSFNPDESWQHVQ